MDALLERAEEFALSIEACFPEAGLDLAEASQHCELAAAACALSIEHAGLLRAALSIGSPNSGSAVLRLQYGALLRAA